MRLRDADAPAFSTALTSIGLEADLLWWRYREGLFTRDGSVRIDDIVALDLEGEALCWTHLTPAADRASAGAITQSWIAEGATPAESARLLLLFRRLQRAVTARRPSPPPPPPASAAPEDPAAAPAGTAASADPAADPPTPATDDDLQASAALVADLCGALQLLSRGRSAEQCRRLKAVLRLLHHPDYDGEREFFLALEQAFRQLGL